MGTPTFRRVDDGWYQLTLLSEEITFDVKRLRWERGELLGVLTVSCGLSDARTVEGVLSVGTFNLTSVSARNTRAKDLASRAMAEDLDFGGWLEELCQRTIKAEEAGREIVLLRDVKLPPAETDQPIDICGFPILLRHPSIIFGDGGTGKSTLALFMAGELERKGVSTLYLDWELDAHDHRRQLERLFGDDLPDVKYLRCERPLTIEAEGIAEKVRNSGVEFVICDSIAFAADGPPEAAETAQRYFRALRQLRVGSLNLAHVTKGDGNDKRPFGSTFWYNGARSVWYAERDAEASVGNVMHVGLFDRKFNLGAHRSNLAVKVEFGNRIAITGTDVADIEQFSKQLPLVQRVRNLLKYGPMTVADLSERTGGNIDTLERYARREADLHMVRGTDGIMRVALNNVGVS